MPLLRLLIRIRHLKIGAGLISLGVLAAFGLNQSPPTTVSPASITMQPFGPAFVHTSGPSNTDAVDENTPDVSMPAAATVETSSTDGAHSVSVTVEPGPSEHASDTAAAQMNDVKNTISVLSNTGSTGTHETSVKINGESMPVDPGAASIDHGDVHLDFQNTGTLDGSDNRSEADIEQTVENNKSTDNDIDNNIDEDVSSGDNDVSGNEGVGSVSNGSTS